MGYLGSLSHHSQVFFAMLRRCTSLRIWLRLGDLEASDLLPSTAGGVVLVKKPRGLPLAVSSSRGGVGTRVAS